MAQEHAQVEQAGLATPRPFVAWASLAILFLAYTLSFLDRTILALLVEPIKRDFDLSDTQMSLLLGLAFSLVYTVSGIPIAILADRGSRSRIVAVGVAFWSLMTAFCGLAGNYLQLFLARMGVGLGEAALGPSAFSIIADLFPPEKRGRAMAIYGAGVKVGAGLAMLIGGTVIAFAAGAQTFDTWFGEVRAWQLVFLVIGPPGLVVALLALTIPESRSRSAAGRDPSIPIRPFVTRNRNAILCHFAGFGFAATTSIAITSWAPTFYIRVHGFSAAEIGWTLGVILLVAGTLGAFAGGALSDHLSRRRDDGPVVAALVGIAGALLAGPIALLVPSALFSLLLLTLGSSLAAFAAPAGAAALQAMVPPTLRARLAAIYLLVVTLISGVVGPTSVALLTDYLFGAPDKVGWSLALVLLVGSVVAGGILVLGLKSIREAIGRARSQA